MLRKNMKKRISCDTRGKITTGNRGKGEKEHPKSLDYFNLVNFPELQQIYGDKPTRIMIMFPSDNLSEFYSTEYSKWGSKGDLKVKTRFCDGETATDGISGESKPCYCRELSVKEQCKAYMGLKAYVLNPENGCVVNFIPYMFENHSENSADNVFFGIEDIHRKLGGRVEGVPFAISVQMVKKLDSNGKKKQFPIWSIQPAAPANRIAALADNAALPIEGIEVKALESGESDKTAMIQQIKKWFKEIPFTDQNFVKTFKIDVLNIVFECKTVEDVYQLDLSALEFGLEKLKSFSEWLDFYMTDVKNNIAKWDYETVKKELAEVEPFQIARGAIPHSVNN